MAANAKSRKKTDGHACVVVPISEVAAPETQRGEYCWRRADGPWLFESLWSILHKFCRSNALTETNLESLLSPRGLEQWPQTYGQRLDLRVTSVLGIQRLGRVVGIPPRQVLEGTVSGLLGMPARTVINELAPEHLRYCPQCITHGYHSTVHQFHCTDRCPTHDTELIDHCPKCGKKFAYALPRSKGAFACEHCGHVLWNGRHTTGTSGTMDRLGDLAAYRDILAECQERGITARDSSFEARRWLIGQTQTSKRFHAMHWFRYLAAATGHPAPRGTRHDEIRHQATRFMIRPAAAHGASSEQHVELATVHKAVGRHFRRRYLKSARRSLAAVCRIRLEECAGESAIKDADEHAAALAYIAWRMLWEQLDHPQDLFGRRLGSLARWAARVEGMFSDGFRFVPNSPVARGLQREIDVRTFALCSIDTFFRLHAHYRAFLAGDAPAAPHFSGTAPISRPLFLLDATDADGAWLHCFAAACDRSVESEATTEGLAAAA